jgi:hypothetical protein
MATKRKTSSKKASSKKSYQVLNTETNWRLISATFIAATVIFAAISVYLIVFSAELMDKVNGIDAKLRNTAPKSQTVETDIEE